MADAAPLNNYSIRKKFWVFTGASFHILDANEEIIGFCRQKAFKLREDIRIFTDESQSQELLVIKARNIIDFSASYDVFDPHTNETVGTLKRKGISSLFRDSWIICDSSETEIATVKEDSLILATIRRHLTNLLPQTFSVQANEKNIAEMRQGFNPFILKLKVNVYQDCPIDARLIMATAVLLSAIEGRQSS